MESARLGTTGLKISRLALGCMSYGDASVKGAHPWAVNDEAAQPFFRQAVELGITFWDTANTYQAGTSEELVGRAIKRYSRREDIVLATKVWGRCTPSPAGRACPAKQSSNRSTPPLRARPLAGSNHSDLRSLSLLAEPARSTVR
jgi:1-deoxyxylulose-5-phosphate synthase